MYILGIHGNFGRSDHAAAATIIRGSEIVAAAEEERFLRQKHATGLFPDRSIRYCLREADIDIHDVDVIAFPRNTWQHFQERLQAYFEYQFGHCPKIEFVQHHLAHVASVFFLSGFPRALCVSIDRSGDGIALAVYRGSGSTLELLHEEPFPNSIGLFAAFMTQYLGFRSNHGEYKVMGLAAYGEPNIDLSFLLDVSENAYHFHDEFLHEEVLRPYPGFPTEQLPIFNREAESKIPHRRFRDEPIQETHSNLAASIQHTIEQAVLAIIKRFKQDGDEYLCLSGGVAHNSTMNGKIASSGMFKDVYVPPAVGDAGTALGAAVAIAVDNGARFSRLESGLLGESFSEDQIQNLLRTCNVNFTHVEDPAETAAELLAKGDTIAWFQGRAELGSRALGARSLLANPSTADMKDKVNRIKHRGDFQPFAPSVLADQVPKHFKSHVRSPFMSFAFPTVPDAASSFPAAIHVDGSARLQTVSATDGMYHSMIRKFYDLTGVLAVLNTSLNSNWEPIVHSPNDALAFFFSSHTDHLLLGPFLLSKPGVH
jgi:carbamoyltransferase